MLISIRCDTRWHVQLSQSSLVLSIFADGCMGVCLGKNNLVIYFFRYIKYIDIFFSIYQTYQYILGDISIDRYISFDLPFIIKTWICLASDKLKKSLVLEKKFFKWKWYTQNLEFDKIMYSVSKVTSVEISSFLSDEHEYYESIEIHETQHLSIYKLCATAFHLIPIVSSWVMDEWSVASLAT